MHGTPLGPTQFSILRTVKPGEAFQSATQAQQVAAMKLHMRGLLDRDLGRRMSRRFIGNAAGQRFIQEHDGVLARAA